jgi:hypothetical protein
MRRRASCLLVGPQPRPSKPMTTAGAALLKGAEGTDLNVINTLQIDGFVRPRQTVPDAADQEARVGSPAVLRRPSAVSPSSWPSQPIYASEYKGTRS